MANQPETFESLPALLSEDMARLPLDAIVTLGILEADGGPAAAVFPLTYTHREMCLAVGPGMQDIAVGWAFLNDYGPVCEVTICFSQERAVATMRGLRIEGEVRLMGPNLAMFRGRRETA